MTLAADPGPARKSHSTEWLFCIGLLLACLVLAGCQQEPSAHQLAGQTMGTTWHATVLPGEGGAGHADSLQADIQAVLDAVNASMSTYRPDSEISRFNALATEEWMPVSSDFYRVLSAALAVGRDSGGAYDVTIGPLVDRWGFGPTPGREELPGAAEIQQLKGQVGQDQLRVEGETSRLKKLAPRRLDFSSIAKGFAVDEVARLLEQRGLHDYLVEVGGEMRLAGHSPRGDTWRIAIEQPDTQGRAVARAIRVTDAAVATSGDYRNYFEVDGVRYSHTIDPRSGRPVNHQLVSVTVIHPSAMLADAWATALSVLGPEEGSAVAKRLGLAVYFMERHEGTLRSRHSESFAPYLEQPGGD